MATVNQDELTDEEQQQLLAQQQAAAGAPPAVPGTDEGASGAGGAKSAAGPTGGSPQSTGLSGFTAVSDYLNANAPQAQDLAGKIAGNLTSQANDITGSIDAADTNFRKSVDDGSGRPDQALVDAAAADPSSVASDPDKLAAFTRARTGTYTGPNSLDESADFPALQGKIQAGQTDAGLVDSEAGRSSLIDRLPGTHTAGMDTLDQLLLEQGPGTQETLKAAAAPFAGITDILDSKRAGAADYATKAKADTQAASQLVADKFTGPGGVLPTFESDVTGRVTAANSDRDKFNSQLSDIIARLQGTQPVGYDNGIQPLTVDELNALQIPQSAFDKYASADSILKGYNDTPIPIANLLSGGRPNSNIPTAGNLATPEDYSKAAALEKLMGGPLSFISQSNAPSAGTYQPNGVMPKLDQAGAQALIDSVSTHDKSAAAGFIRDFAPQLQSLLQSDPNTAYAHALELIRQDAEDLQNTTGQSGILGGQQVLAALNRLVNGFGAPDLNFTPVQSGPPFLQPPVPVPSGGGGGGFHTF